MNIQAIFKRHRNNAANWMAFARKKWRQGRIFIVMIPNQEVGELN